MGREGQGCLDHVLVLHLNTTYARCSVVTASFVFFCFYGLFPVVLLSALLLDHYAYRFVWLLLLNVRVLENMCLPAVG